MEVEVNSASKLTRALIPSFPTGGILERNSDHPDLLGLAMPLMISADSPGGVVKGAVACLCYHRRHGADSMHIQSAGPRAGSSVLKQEVSRVFDATA